MYINSIKAFSLTFLVLVAGFSLCSGNNGTSPQTGDGSTPTEKSSLEKGMEPIYDLLHGFLDTVMPHNFYSQDDAPFSVQDLDKIIKDSDYAKLQQDWQDLFKTFGGFAACFILGLLFVIFFPIVASCFCCCFCCCKNCGGAKDRYDSSKRSSCMRMMCATLLLVFTTLMLAGGIITFLGAELFHQALKNEDNKGVLGRVDNSLVTLQTFTGDTVQELKTKTQEKVGNGLTSVSNEVEDTVHKTVELIKNTINATSILNQTEHLGNASLEINEDLTKIKTSLNHLKTLQTNISSTLNDTKNKIDTACVNSCSLDTSGLVFNPDFSTLDELDSQAAEINKTSEISNLIKDAKSKFDKVSADVDKEVGSNIETAKNKTEEIRTQLFSQLNRVDNASEPFNKSIEDGRQFIRDNQKDIGRYSDYIWYGCIGLGSSVMLVVFFYYMGTLFGMCGERPGRQAACCNRGTGANLLYTGVWLSALFSWIVMLLVAILFLTGGLGYTLVCRYIGPGIENVGTFETVVQDSMGWNVSQAFSVKNLSISGMFQNCKDNQAIYTALHFESLFNIDDIVNVTDIQSQVDGMTRHSFTLDNITLMTPELKNQLMDFLNAGLTNISFSQYTAELDKNPVNADLSSVATQLEDAAQQLDPTQPTQAQSLREAAQEIRDLQSVQLAQVDQEKDRLRAALSRLESQVNLTHEINTLIDGIESAQDNFNSRSQQLVQTSISEAAEAVKKLIKDIVDDSISMVKTDIGKCRPLYDAAQGVADGVCDLGLDSFNAIWFGLGWAAFFYIPCFVCAAFLAALYMKIGPYQDDPKRDFDDPNHDTYNGYAGGHQDNIPLTSQHMQDRINGKYNGAYDRSEGIDYGRDPRSSGYGYDPYQGHGSGYHEGGGYGASQLQPPNYDDLSMPGRSSGGYPKSHNY